MGAIGWIVLLWAGCGPADPVGKVVPDPQDPDGNEPKVAAPTDVWPSSTPPSDVPANPNVGSVADYAWQQFLALSWPADPNNRGQPNTGVSFDSAGIVVWESYKADYEVFLPDGSTPPAWNAYGPIPPECQALGANAGARVISRISKSPSDSGSDVFEKVEEAVGGTLTDQHGNLARYELRMNQTEFDFVVGANLYNTNGQDQLQGPVTMATGSTEIKGAWRQLTSADGPNVRDRMYVLSAYMYTPAMGGSPATCSLQDLGLVGLHITAKTPSRPQWTWATFEQIDNVPPWGTETPGPVPYSFNNPSCPVTQCVPNQSTEQGGLPTTTPTQVTRVIAIDDAVAAVNAQYQQKLQATYPGIPWQYYQLVGLQFPRQPAMPTGDPTPMNASNVTLETYLGEDSSCMDCHYMAKTASTTNPQTSDFSYFLAEAKPQQTAPEKK